MNPFYLISLLSITAAFLSVAVQGASFVDLLPALSALNWLRVHFITIGTVTMFLFGTAPRLLAHRLKGRPQSAAMTWAQWGLLNVGYVLVLVGMPGNSGWLASTGAWMIFAAVVLLLYSLVQIGRSAPGGESTARRFYITAPFFFLWGITMAVSMLLNWSAPGGRSGILEGHVHANVWGFLAFIVAGTLLDLFPRLLKTDLARPRWVGATYWLMLLGGIGLVLGPWLALNRFTVATLFIYVAGTALLLANLIITLTHSKVGFPAAAGHLLFGYLWMITPVFFGPFIMLAPNLVPGGRIEAAATQALVLGWVLQMAMGGIPAILQGIYPGMVKNPDDGKGRFGRGWPCVILVNLGNLLIWVANLMSPGPYSMPGVALGFGLIALGVLPFLVRLWMTYTQRFDTAA